MIPPLNEIVGLPPATSPAELDCASEQHFKTLIERAARGEANAQGELVKLRVAYLNWAYLGREVEKAAGRNGMHVFNTGLQAGPGSMADATVPVAG